MDSPLPAVRAAGIARATQRGRLLGLLLLLLLVVDVEVAELVRGLVGGNHAQPVADLLLLQVLLRQVLDVAAQCGVVRREPVDRLAG